MYHLLDTEILAEATEPTPASTIAPKGEFAPQEKSPTRVGSFSDAEMVYLYASHAALYGTPVYAPGKDQWGSRVVVFSHHNTDDPEGRAHYHYQCFRALVEASEEPRHAIYLVGHLRVDFDYLRERSPQSVLELESLALRVVQHIGPQFKRHEAEELLLHARPGVMQDLARDILSDCKAV